MVALTTAPALVRRRTGEAQCTDVPGRLRLCGAIEHEVAGHVARQPRLYRAWKRTTDIVLALGLGVWALVVIAVAAPLIVLESPGPVLYRQVRLGHHGRPFTIYKLRSMEVGAEAPGHARWASEDDPRITRVGKLLRRSRLDELPQVWNVIRGDMAIVGPRPERPEFADELEAAHPGFHLRLLTKPGLTGLAQVRHRYTATVAEARVKLEHDLYYLRHAGYRLDLQILARTALIVLSMGGR